MAPSDLHEPLVRATPHVPGQSAPQSIKSVRSSAADEVSEPRLHPCSTGTVSPLADYGREDLAAASSSMPRNHLASACRMSITR